MTATEDKQLLQQIFSELALGNSRALVESMSEDFCWTVAGSNDWAGTYRGKQAVLDTLLARLRSRIEGRVKTIAHRFIAEGDFVVVEARGNNTTKTGVPYNNVIASSFAWLKAGCRRSLKYMDTELVSYVLGEGAA